MSGWDAWNAYIMAIKDVSGGGIYTLAGVPCAQSGLNISQQEIQAMVNGLLGETMSALVIGGQKYMLLRKDGDALHARKGPQPASILKTKTLLLVGVGAAGAGAEMLYVELNKVADMLKEQNL